MKLKLVMFRIANGIVISLITFFSTLSVSYPPSIQNVYAALIAFALTFLVQLKGILDEVCGKKTGGGKIWSNLLMII